MHLAVRRSISAIINGFVVVIFLTSIFIATAFLLWFTGLRNHLDMRWFALIFAFSYSLLGSYSIARLPQLGRIIAKISQCETRNSPPRKVKLFMCLALFYLGSTIVLLILDSLFAILNFRDERSVVFLFFPIVFCVFLSLLIIPVSIVVGSGRQGLHDALSGIAFCRTGGNVGTLLPFKKLLLRSFMVGSIAAFIFTAIAVKLLLTTPFAEILIASTGRSPMRESLEATVTELDLIAPTTSIKCRSYDASDGFKWWVDLTCDKQEQIRTAQAIGLAPLNTLDLIGYGVNIKRLSHPIRLLELDRVMRQTLAAGTEVTTVHLFVGTGAFHFPEVMKKIHRHFSKKFDALPNKRGILRIKVTRLAKVGFAEIGYFDESYLVDHQEWRDERNAYLPVILNFDTRMQPGGAFITSTDLD